MLSRCEYTNTKKFSFCYKTNENQKTVLGRVLILTNHIISSLLKGFYPLIWDDFLINISAWIFEIIYIKRDCKPLLNFSIRDKFDFITQQIWSHVSIDLNLKIKISAPKSLKYLRLFWEKYFSLTLSKIFIEVHEMVYAQRTFLKISSAYANNDLLQNTHHCRHNQPCHRT